MAFVTARAAVSYHGPARKLVHAWKEHALRRGATLAAELVVAHLEPPAADVITYIPPDVDRLLQRGHHPAEQLAAELSQRWRIPHAPLLARTRPRGRQTDLSGAERRRNVRGAFRAAGTVSGTVLLVDDVYTTGSTTAAAATALRSGGARAIHVVTFARTVR